MLPHMRILASIETDKQGEQQQRQQQYRCLAAITFVSARVREKILKEPARWQKTANKVLIKKQILLKQSKNYCVFDTIIKKLNNQKWCIKELA